jgi:mannitol/fructose-specific phosphotransferase system IIA component (Ntr-type)
MNPFLAFNEITYSTDSHSPLLKNVNNFIGTKKFLDNLNSQKSF